MTPYPSLLTVHDLPGFWEEEARVATGEGMDEPEQRRRNFALAPLRDQAALLEVESLLLARPDIQFVEVLMGCTSSQQWSVDVRAHLESGRVLDREDPGVGHLDDALNNMTLTTEMLVALGQEPVTLQRWRDVATAWLGPEWWTERETRVLEQSLPTLAIPRPTGPRL